MLPQPTRRARLLVAASVRAAPVNNQVSAALAACGQRLLLGALCLLGGCFLAACRGDLAPAASARNVVLITIDTLRADHLGAYGYGRGGPPALDALAAGGVAFDRAYAAAPITLPSHASILTGRYPP